MQSEKSCGGTAPPISRALKILPRKQQQPKTSKPSFVIVSRPTEFPISPLGREDKDALDKSPVRPWEGGAFLEWVFSFRGSEWKNWANYRAGI